MTNTELIKAARLEWCGLNWSPDISDAARCGDEQFLPPNSTCPSLVVEALP